MKADEKFLLCATMNPSGDFGKKELSPALRNRFTEIWVPSTYTKSDLERVLSFLLKDLQLSNEILTKLVDFFEWLNVELAPNYILSYRDIRTWCSFVIAVTRRKSLNDMNSTFIHATCLVLIDGLRTLDLMGGSEAILTFKQKCLNYYKSSFGHQSDCLQWMVGNGDIEAKL